MAAVAKALVSSQVDAAAKGLEGTFGLNNKPDEKKIKDAATRELKERKEKRQREKEEYHQQKEAQRQSIRDKYQLSNKNTTGHNNIQKKCTIA